MGLPTLARLLPGEQEKDEARFYGQIVSNARIVLKHANKGLKDTVILKGKVEREMDSLGLSRFLEHCILRNHTNFIKNCCSAIQKNKVIRRRIQRFTSNGV